MSLTVRAIAYTIVALALIAAPHAHAPTDAQPEASPPLTKADWSGADLVCEIDGDVWAVDIDTKEPQKVLLIKNARNPTVRPGTRDIAFVRGADIWLWSATDRSETRLAEAALGSSHTDSKPRLLGRLAWHPEGRWIAFSTWQRITWQPSNPLPNACRYYDPGYEGEFCLFGDDGDEEATEPAKEPDLAAPRGFPFECVRLLDTQNRACYDLIGPDIDTEWGVMLGASAPAWSPDGTSIAYVRGGDVWELEYMKLPEDAKRNAKWANGRLRALGNWFYAQGMSPWSTGAKEVCYTLDGKAVICSIRRLAGTGDWETAILASGKPLEQLPPPIDPIGDPWLSRLLASLDLEFYDFTIAADGKRVAYTFGPDTWVCESPSVKPRLVVKGGTCPSWIEVSPE
jgi:hypothetical protein